jgi:glycine/D-amino acid oxidase-like deaminating enzyme
VEVVTVTDLYDVVVIGGGAAGLNGALMLARSRRSVLVVDAGAPRNAPATAVHGLLGRDGMPPAGLRERWGRDVVHCPYCCARWRQDGTAPTPLKIAGAVGRKP